MIGAELADRVSPVAALRPELLLPDGSLDCWACGQAFTSCSHSTAFEAPETTFAEEVARLVAEKASQQVRRGPGRPPKTRPGPPEETVAAPDAVDTPVSAPDVPVAPMVAPPAPEVAPVGPAPTETAVVADAVPSTADAPPVPAAAAPPVEPPMVRPPGPAPSVIGADYGQPGVQTLSPVAPEAVPRVAAASVDVGGAQTVTDVVETPTGFMSPDSDPHRPNAVLVNDPAQIWATGAWMRLPGSTTAAVTMEIQQVFWSQSMKQPLYRMMHPQGAVIPLPINLQG